ncbi:polysaccharide deacetylase family protein [Flavobacterium sp. 25HG05S-40]|uniref:polysaccharide deacetylase family protein n=1 Tax=Flavobacterium sp. 25HG05S-40 TaxID=3458682 RepID=UPI0040447269
MLTVCNFHYIRSNFDTAFPSIFGVTPYQFENQLNELNKLGEFICQQQLIQEIDALLQSETNYILVTFDDGLKEQFEVAKPILERLNIPAIYYINSLNFIEKEVSLVHKIHLLRSIIAPKAFLKFIENFFEGESMQLTQDEIAKAEKHYNYDDSESACLKYFLNFKLGTSKLAEVITALFEENFDSKQVVESLYMTENQLYELSSSNMLGNHTHSHHALGLLSYDEIVAEIAKTKTFIDNFGHSHPYSISYPYGSAEACQAPVSEIAHSFGHTVGFTMERGSNDATCNTLLLKRFDCNDLPGGKNYMQQ